jgi:hypothetical protein
MAMHESSRAALAGLLLISCGGSGGGPRAPEGSGPEPVTTRQLLPLEHDTVFSYETTSDEHQKGLMVLHVRQPRTGLVELDIAGRVQRLDVDETSVMHSSGGYLLKDPIQRGASFRGAFGEVRVTQLNAAVHVPAGKFEGCVVTVEENAQPFKRAESTYCPGVGLVSLVVEGASEGDVLRVESTLKSHGPRVTFR